MIVGQRLLQRKWEEPAGEHEASVVSVAVGVVLPLISGVCGCLEVKKAGSSRLSPIGARLVLNSDLPDHCGCEQAGFLGDLSKNRFFQSFASLTPPAGTWVPASGIPM